MEKINFKLLDDEELIRLIHSNIEVEKCWNVISNRYYDKIMIRCKSYLKNEIYIEDVAHELLLHILLKVSTFQFRSKFSTWLFSIVNNRCIDHLRKTKRKVETVIDKDLESEIEDILEDQLEDVEYGVLEKALLRLNPKDRDLIEKCYVEKKNIRAISLEYKTTEGAIKMKLLRIKKKLKAELR